MPCFGPFRSLVVLSRKMDTTNRSVARAEGLLDVVVEQCGWRHSAPLVHSHWLTEGLSTHCPGVGSG